jgi:MEDS: MEthanogen/methylotroph, DcmR Sensory domain
VADALAAWRESDQHVHIVQFYERDNFMVTEAGRFIGTAIGAGDSGIVIATKPHRRWDSATIDMAWFEYDHGDRSGTVSGFGCAGTLAKFMISGQADRERFTSVIGEVVERARKAAGREGARVAAFGEMVALLWAEGKREAAIGLEQLWNFLAETHAFSLQCAYPMKGFSRRDHSEPFLKICAEHSSVLPRKVTWR